MIIVARRTSLSSSANSAAAILCADWRDSRPNLADAGIDKHLADRAAFPTHTAPL